MTHPTHTTGSARHLRALSTAGRLLAGAGSCGVRAEAAQDEEARVAVAHGLRTEGQLVVALSTPAWPDEGRSEVRIRIDKYGALAQAHLVTASAHLLGSARLVGHEEVLGWSADGALPGLVSLAACAGGCRVVEIDAGSILVHDPDGVVVIGLDDAVDFPCFPLPAQECDALELVRALGHRRLAALGREVDAGSREGSAGPALPVPHGWDRLAGQTLVVDVDTAGCTLLQIGVCHSRTVFVPFDHPVGSVEELRDAVASLAPRAASSPPPS